MRKSLYDYLQVSPAADELVIRAAYRSLLQRYHPDKNPGDANAENLCKILNHALEVLTDPAQRAEYDAKLAAERATQHRENSRSSNSQAGPRPEPQPTPRPRSGGAHRPSTRESTQASTPHLDPVDQRWEEMRPLYRAAIAGKYADRILPAEVLKDRSQTFIVVGWIGYGVVPLVVGVLMFNGTIDKDWIQPAFGFAAMALALFSACGHFVPNGRVIQQSRATYYYLKVFRQFFDKKKKLWKDPGWWVMFVPGLWLPFRKLYGLAILYFSCLVGLDLLERYANLKWPMAPVLVAIGFASASNQMYFDSVSRKVRLQLFATPDREAARKMLAEKGGTNVWIAAASMLLFMIGIGVMEEFLPAANQASMAAPSNRAVGNKQSVPTGAPPSASSSPQMTEAEAREQAKFDRVVDFLITTYPELNSESKQYQNWAVEEIKKAKEQHERNGVGSADALAQAAREKGYAVPNFK